MTDDSVAFDAVLDLCRDGHRRIVLGVLADQDRPLTMQDLAKAIVRHNHHTPFPAVSGETVTEVQHALHHRHVPKLVASNVVDYDAARRTVAPTGFDRLQPALSAILDADPDLSPPLEL
ncbi:hypothetical protein SAMN05216559_0031 [Halomicrobium zhouii]|uniref:DUF7344 domain-containing protein n=1 Tax=Halomicrobium zhouii TaxID=767519 RepID=A0A1I6K1P9_9EURY|nr:hypothetical protein [Halomicrobium zhouii]SFR85097.1 hypothetical protein SAMN05216559_0031 [Halomicrobium zhouii]